MLYLGFAFWIFGALMIFYVKKNEASKGKAWAYSNDIVVLWMFLLGFISIAFYMMVLLGIVMFILAVFISIGVSQNLDKKSFELIKPKDTKDFVRIRVSNKNDEQKLGIDKDHDAKFMAIDNENRVSFPQSAKPDTKYYLTDVSFQPKFETTQTVQGKSGHAFAGAVLAGPVGAAIGSAGKRKVKSTTTEKVSTAYLSLLTTDYSTAYTVQISCKTALYNQLVSEYELDPVALMRIEKELKDSL